MWNQPTILGVLMERRLGSCSSPLSLPLDSHSGMDRFSCLPTLPLCVIHDRVGRAGGLRAALSLEATSKRLNRLFRSNRRLNQQVLVTNEDLTSRTRSRSMWLFVATHGHRLGGISFNSTSAELPRLSAQAGVDRARAVGVEFPSYSHSLQVLAGLPNLHHLCCRQLCGSSNLGLLPSLTMLRSLELDSCPINLGAAI
jgi:hypothetical protein